MAREKKPTVLIVEDELFVRISVAASLADAGWQPLEAEDADEAEALIKRHPETRVLFTDINLPGPINGLELARRVGEAHPSIGLVLTSGAERLNDGELPENGAFLSKPYRESELLAVLEQKLQI